MKNCLNYFFAILLIAAMISCTSGIKRNLNLNWKQDLTTSIEAFKECDQTLQNGVNPCGKYIGESVNLVYNVNDFYSEKLGRYLSVTEIIEYLNTGNEWVSLGKATDQIALTEAQNLANSQNAVIAAYLGEDKTGHVSIILPGTLTKSGAWGMEAPNSVSFFIANKGKSYLDKGLSYAFNKNMLGHVTLFARNY